MLTIDGLISGLDTTSIIDGLLSIQQQQIERYDARKQDVTTEQTAFKGVEARLLTLRSTVSLLARSQANVLNARTVTSSHPDFLTAAATSSAEPGVYNIRVNSLARAHQIASQGFASPDSSITQGTLVIQVGAGAATTVTIDSTNDTLQGLAGAINAAVDGASATIVDDGSGATPYRLLLTSDNTGTDYAITITNNLAADNGNAVRPDFSGPDVQAATDASITIGSGAGALTIASSTNVIDDVIQGVTLKLLGVSGGTDISLTVARDTEPAREAIDDFVESFNDLMEYIDEQVRYDAETENAGILVGNRSVLSIQETVRNEVLAAVPGLGSSANRLGAIGISVNDAGRLVVDSARLDDVLSGRDPTVTSLDLQRLFALTGESTNPGIRFLGGSTRTEVSAAGYQVDISQAAERATVTAPNALASSIVIDNTNNTIQFTIDGRASSTLTLASGTYTRQELADHLEALINNDEELAGRSVSVTLEGDALKITSNSYGYSSEVTVGSGTALATLGFAGSESDRGQDVVGKFIVDGVDEPARGSGQLLIGDADNAHTADLQLRVSLTGSQVQAGVDGTVTVTRGIASRLDQVLGDLLDPVTGQVKTVNDGFDSRIESIDAAVDRLNELFESRREALLAQFAALESAINELQTTSSLLANQLTLLTNRNSQSKGK